MFDFLVPILIFAVPVMAVVAVALVTGRRLQGSCGGVGPDGSCSRCGKPAAQMSAAQMPAAESSAHQKRPGTAGVCN